MQFWPNTLHDDDTHGISSRQQLQLHFGAPGCRIRVVICATYLPYRILYIGVYVSSHYEALRVRNQQDVVPLFSSVFPDETFELVLFPSPA